MTVNEAGIFTKNNQFLIQDEIKNIVEKIWSTEYCTLHSVPIYYREVDDQLKHYWLCIIFDDSLHDTSFVYQMQKTLVQNLKEKLQ